MLEPLYTVESLCIIIFNMKHFTSNFYKSNFYKSNFYKRFNNKNESTCTTEQTLTQKRKLL
jgi:hypothetical protein